MMLRLHLASCTMHEQVLTVSIHPCYVWQHCDAENKQARHFLNVGGNHQRISPFSIKSWSYTT